MTNDFIKEHCPKLSKLLEGSQNKPTTEERISALESAVADLAMQALSTGGMEE